MVESESIRKGQLVLEKVTAVQEGLLKTLSQIITAVDQNKLADLASLHSQAPSGDACQIEDLEPATCPTGSDHIEDLKRKGESGEEECEQKATAAKVVLADLDRKARKIDATGLALKMENRLSSLLEELKKVTEKTAAVFGDAHQVKGMDEVLEAAGVSSSLSKASKEEEYEKLSKLLSKEYFEALNEVSQELILQNGLPMELDKIVAILDECDSVHQIGEAAGHWRKEVQKVNGDLKKHLVSVQEQQMLCTKRRTDADKNVKTCLAKVEKTLEILTGDLSKYKDAVITNKAQSMMQTELQNKEQAILDEINRAKDISPAADAALASCTNQAVETKNEIDRITKETAAGLKERAQLPWNLAVEGTEVALEILFRAEDQKKKQIQVTEKELAAFERALQQKTEDFNQGVGERTALAQTMSEVEDRRKSLQQQKEELCKVQETKGKAENQHESLRWLENVTFSFHKPAISPRSKVKENAGEFKMFQVPQEVQEAEPIPEVGTPGPESHALWTEVPSLIEKIVQETLQEKWAIQEDYDRFENDKLELEKEKLEEDKQKLERENDFLKQQMHRLQALLQARGDDGSDACSDTSTTPWEVLESEGPSQQPLPALEDEPSPV